MLRIAVGAIYLLHFHRPLGDAANPRGRASHYVGWSLDPQTRELEHRAGQGAAITRAAVQQGITWDFFILGEGTRDLERQIKERHEHPRLCPLCGRSHRRGALRLPRLGWRQLELPLVEPDPFGLIPPPAVARVDWVELQSRRRAHTFTGDRALGEALAADLGIPW